MNPERGSRFGEDLLGAGLGHPVDDAGADETPVAKDRVFGGPARRPPGAVGGGPSHREGVAIDDALAMDDGPGHDPLDFDFSGVVAGGDRDTPGVLDSVGVDAIDDVRAEDAGALLELGTGETGDGEEHDGGEQEGPGHGAQTTGGLRPIFKWLIGIGAVVLVGVMAFAIFEPVQVLPRIRVAPGFALVDQSGAAFTSEDGRGAVTLYTFLPTDCGDECTGVNETMREVGAAAAVDLADADFRQVTVALDTGDPARLTAAASRSGADGEVWRWVGADETTLHDVVGEGFRVFYEETSDGVEFDPVFVIVDSAGLIRGDYRYSTLASDTDRLSRHISLLGAELRNSEGAASLVYEAAHIFLCYP
jgi:protein SCO1/2